MTRLVWTLPDGQQTARWAEDEGGSGALLWTQFSSLAGDEILDTNTGVIAFGDTAFGNGTLTSVTAWTDPDDDPGILITDPGQYLVSLTTNQGFGFANVVEPADLEIEVQVYNSENDPYQVLTVLRPADPFVEGAMSAVIGFYEGDAQKGFAIVVRPRGCDFTPANGMILLKVIQLA